MTQHLCFSKYINKCCKQSVLRKYINKCENKYAKVFKKVFRFGSVLTLRPNLFPNFEIKFRGPLIFFEISLKSILGVGTTSIARTEVSSVSPYSETSKQKGVISRTKYRVKIDLSLWKSTLARVQ